VFGIANAGRDPGIEEARHLLHGAALRDQADQEPPCARDQPHSCSVSISSSPPNHWDYDRDYEHYHQEQRDFPTPRDWRDVSDRYSKSDHASSYDRVMPSLDARLFPESPKRSLADLEWLLISSHRTSLA
jgi:hypothetical protein